MDAKTTTFAINAILYILTFLFFYKRSGLSVGTNIWAIYTVSAIAAFFFIQQPDFAGTLHDMPYYSLEGLIYLYFCLLICIFPLSLLKKAIPGHINFSHPEAIKWLMIGSIIVQILFILIDLSNAEAILSVDEQMLADIREDQYEGALSARAENLLTAKLDFLFGCIPTMCLGISAYLFLTYARYKKLSVLLFLTSLGCIVETVLVNVSRGEMVMNILYIAVLIMYLRDFMSKKVKTILVLYTIPAFLVIFAFFWAISVSRFGDLANFMMFKYLGEPMVNFAGNLYPLIDGHTNGAAYFPHFHKLFTGADIAFQDTRAKWEFIENHAHIEPHIFYTFLGGLVIDFGYFWTVVISLICSFFCFQLAKHCNNMSFGGICALLFFIFAYCSGVFFLAIQTGRGTFMIIYTIILSWYFKSRHERRRTHISPRT